MISDRSWIFGAALFRSVGIGLLGVLLALYWVSGGLDAGQIGLLVALGLAGSAAGTFGVSFWADRIGRKKTLILLSFLQMVGGMGLFWFPHFWGLAALTFLGMVNAMGRERGPFFTLEQAILPETIPDSQRTHLLAWYNWVIDIGLGLGSLLGGIPILFRSHWGLTDFQSYQWTVLLYVALCGMALLTYLFLSSKVEIHSPTPLPAGRQAWHHVPLQTRKIITKLSLLFGFDSLAGGFLPATIIAYWFFKRFGIGEELLAPLFFAGHIVNAFSYLVAAWLARHIGLIKTMVFTHLPANLCLIAIAFVPDLIWAMILFIVREFLVEMDVPTRQSYVMGMVAPKERTLASGVTNLTRSAAWVAGPGMAGWVMKSFYLGAPLIIGGSLKVIYDLLLFFQFRHIKTPEEKGRTVWGRSRKGHPVDCPPTERPE
jgi:MFS family permease